MEKLLEKTRNNRQLELTEKRLDNPIL